MKSLPQYYTGTYPVCAESLLFLHHPVPMWVVDEETLRFLAVNDAAVARYGYTREEFLSMTSADIRSPEDLPRLRAQVASDDWRSHGMWRHRTKSGAWLDVEAMAHGVNFRGRRAVVVNAYDVSERVRQTGELEQARRELEASEARYRTLVESMEEIVWAADLSGVLTYVSAVVRRFGYAATELVGRPLWSLVHPDDVEPVRAACTPQFDCDRLPRDLRVVTRDGEVRRVRTSARPQPARTGSAASITGVLSDITDTYVAQEQRQVAQRYELVGQLAGGVAHDFNNLLVVINGYAELAAASLEEGHPAREDLGQVIEAGNKAATLTQRLLAFGRKQMLQPRSVDLGAAVQGMEGMLRRLIGEHIQLIIDCPPDLPTVYLDPAQFEHMLMNLAVNARDAMPTGGTLTIRTRFPQVGDTYDDGPSRDGLLFLSVSDTGHGMDAAVQARIFDPFFTTRPLGQGSGLGLSMVHGFVEQSGGTIAVDSVPNTGTTFRIGLPVEHAHPFDELQPRDMSRRAAAGTVLVTEDEPAVRALVARTLKDAGYDVLVPDTPAAAIDVCEHYTGTIDLLLTDVVMPGLNGQELASRAAASRPSMRVLFMSGYSETARATVTGCDFAVLEKPFNAASLTRAVRDALMPERETCVTTVTGV